MVVLARRRGEVWFLAILGGPGAISFDESRPFRCARETAQSADVLHLDLQPGGGYLARFTTGE